MDCADRHKDCRRNEKDLEQYRMKSLQPWRHERGEPTRAAMMNQSSIPMFLSVYREYMRMATTIIQMEVSIQHIAKSAGPLSLSLSFGLCGGFISILSS